MPVAPAKEWLKRDFWLKITAELKWVSCYKLPVFCYFYRSKLSNKGMVKCRFL